MGKKKISFQEQLQKLCFDMNRVSALMSDIEGDALAFAMAEQIRKTADFIYRVPDGKGDVSKESLQDCGTELREALIHYNMGYQHLTGERKRSHAALNKELKKVIGRFVSREDGVVEKFQEMLQATEDEREKYARQEGEDLLQTFEREHSVNGHAPGLPELQEMSIEGSDPERVFEALIWLGQRSARVRSERLIKEGELEKNTYHEQYVRLLEELNRAPLDIQMQYVRMFNRQEIMNQDKLAAEYDTLYDAALQENALQGAGPQRAEQQGNADPNAAQQGNADPNAVRQGNEDPNAARQGNADPSAAQQGNADLALTEEEKKARAHEAARNALMVTDLYLHAQSFHLMCGEMKGVMGSLIQQTQRLPEGDEQPGEQVREQNHKKPSIAKRQKHIADLLDDGITQAQNQGADPAQHQGADPAQIPAGHQAQNQGADPAQIPAGHQAQNQGADPAQIPAGHQAQNQGANQAPRRDADLAKIREANRAKIREEIQRTYLDTNLADRAQSLLRDALETRGNTSPTYRAMARMLADFARENHNDIANPKRYEKKMIACERAARQYKRLHQEETANPRYQLSMRIIELCNSAREAFLTKQNTASEKEIAALRHLKNKKAEDLARLARLQKNAATGGIEPNIRDENPPVPRMQRFLRGLGHAMTSILAGLEAVTIGLPGNIAGIAVGTYNYIIKTPIRWFRHGSMKRTVVGVVPGERDEKLQNRLSDAVDPMTGVLTDVRRIPLVWEKPVPDDPNQPPTVSFRVRQPRPGSAIAEVMTAEGEDSAHSHICIRYSKIDPITGKLQRYETTFGFWGKGGFWDKHSTRAMVQIGYRIPGEIKSDGGTYSAEKTVEVNYQQINDLIRYTQVYETGGYNLFERNCTTFLADAAQAIGIDMKEILQKRDFTSESNKTKVGHLILPVMGTLLLTANAEQHAMDRVTRDDLTYQRLGQKMVGAEHFERVTHQSLNVRMAGYSPGASGQGIRADAQYSIRNLDKEQLRKGKERKEGEIRRILDERNSNADAGMESNFWGFEADSTVESIMRETPITASLLGIRKLCFDTFEKLSPDIINRANHAEDFRKTLNQIVDYVDHMTKAIAACENGNMTFEDDSRKMQEAYAKGSALTQEFLEDMDHFFAVNFRSDADMLDSFREIAAMGQELKEIFDYGYRIEKRNRDCEAFLTGNSIQRTRDMAVIANAYLQKEKTFSLHVKSADQRRTESGSFSLSRIMSALRVYGNLRQFVADGNRYRELLHKDRRTKAENGEVKRIERKIEAVDTVAKSLQYLPMKKHFSNSNLNLLFHTLPAQAEYSGKAGQDDPIRMLQCMAYEHVFGGILQTAGKGLEDAARNAKRQLEEYSREKTKWEEDARQVKEQCDQVMYQGQASMEEKIQMQRRLEEFAERMGKRMEEIDAEIEGICKGYMVDAAGSIRTTLRSRLATLTDADKMYLRKIQTCIAQRMYENDRKADSRLEPTDRDYAVLAANEIIDTLAGTYSAQTLKVIMQRVGGPEENSVPSKHAELNTERIHEGLAIPEFMRVPLPGLTKEENPNLLIKEAHLVAEEGREVPPGHLSPVQAF